MDFAPHPTELRRVDRDEDGAHRNVFCPHYTRCLDGAVRAGWSDFTCARCTLRDRADSAPSAGDFAHDRRRGPSIP